MPRYHVLFGYQLFNVFVFMPIERIYARISEFGNRRYGEIILFLRNSARIVIEPGHYIAIIVSEHHGSLTSHSVSKFFNRFRRIKVLIVTKRAGCDFIRTGLLPL